jgi:hypothetical protein
VGGHIVKAPIILLFARRKTVFADGFKLSRYCRFTVQFKTLHPRWGRHCRDYSLELVALQCSPVFDVEKPAGPDLDVPMTPQRQTLAPRSQALWWKTTPKSLTKWTKTISQSQAPSVTSESTAST